MYIEAKAYTPPRQLRRYRGLSKSREIHKKKLCTEKSPRLPIRSANHVHGNKRQSGKSELFKDGLEIICASGVEKPDSTTKAKNSTGIRVPGKDGMAVLDGP